MVVLDEKFLDNSNEYFLGDVLAANTTSANFFQSGGHGTTSAIQLRGLPKRYSTVYIDGVKMSDPSSVSGDYDFNHILTSQISRVEILKGNQSSVYGSGAIGGTINITTKKGKPGLDRSLSYKTGSHGTNNLSFSYSGANEDNNFYIGFERFQTDGISQMVHNEEKDRYRNNSLVANYARKFSDNIQSLGQAPEFFVQVNTGEEKQKAGISPLLVDEFIDTCRQVYDLPVVGLMCIPPVNEEPALHFALLKKIADRNGLMRLSMGMSSDFVSAIKFGSTDVRVGSAIFGQRS